MSRGEGRDEPRCILLAECDSPDRCAAERFCGAYLDDLRSDDPVDEDADDLIVLRGWSGLPEQAEAADHDLTVMPRWRFDDAVKRLAAKGHVKTGIFGEIRGATPAGRAALALAPPHRSPDHERTSP